MIAIAVIVLIFVVLFVSAFVTRRRFGILGLGLIAGTIIAGLFGEYTSFLIATYAHWAFTPGKIDIPPQTTATIVLTLAPALLLLISGPRYNKGRSALVSSLAFAAVALLLVIGQSVANFGISDAAYSAERTIHGFFPFIVVGVVIISVIDIIMGRGPGFKSSSKH